MRTLTKQRIKRLKSVYMELDKDDLCEILATVICCLSGNGIFVKIPILTKSKIEDLIERGFIESADEIPKEPIADKIRISYSKHDDEVLLEFMHKVMKFKESEGNHAERID